MPARQTSEICEKSLNPALKERKMLERFSLKFCMDLFG